MIIMNKLYFVEPTPHHDNFGLQMWGDEELIRNFLFWSFMLFNAQRIDDLLYREKKNLGCFWQGHTKDWLYLEFWMDQSEANRLKLYKYGERIAKELEVEFIR